MNEEILGGLKSALERGESLKRAMTTFFNSGYNKSEIEEAARALSETDLEKRIQPSPVIPETPEAPSFSKTPEKLIKEKKPFTLFEKSPEKTIQKVSRYEGDSKRKNTYNYFNNLFNFFSRCFIIHLFIQATIN